MGTLVSAIRPVGSSEGQRCFGIWLYTRELSSYEITREWSRKMHESHGKLCFCLCVPGLRMSMNGV